MTNIECPHCRQAVIPIWKKFTVGPVTSTSCPGCGGKVGVPWLSVLAVLPFLAAAGAAVFIDSTAIAEALCVAGLAIYLGALYLWVPLVAKK